MHHFVFNNLDAIFVVCNAPGRSGLNRVERRRAPLSKELAGVILPHDTFGSHLDASERTTNDELELRNFANTGAVLAEIWSNLTFDGYPVVAEYVTPKQGHLKKHANKHKVLWTKETIAPKKILARRDNESLVVFQSYDDEEDVEWLDDDLIEFNNGAVVYNNPEDSV